MTIEIRSPMDEIMSLHDRIGVLKWEVTKLRRANNELLSKNLKLREDNERIARGAPPRIQPQSVLCHRHRLCVYLDGHINSCRDSSHRALAPSWTFDA